MGGLGDVDAGSERSCTVRADGDGLRLSGTIPVVADGAACTWLLVDAVGDDGVVQVLVRTDASGVSSVHWKVST